ncbi:MAG: hypothetical protein H7A25_07230 [Leptospiraceae bacterium]|nr:hypothetical protein [Leptospiraceae bacterium]MCP5499676.1 hypothetical protein [Leptospiraceae bacterium]
MAAATGKYEVFMEVLHYNPNLKLKDDKGLTVNSYVINELAEVKEQTIRGSKRYKYLTETLKISPENVFASRSWREPWLRSRLVVLNTGIQNHKSCFEQLKSKTSMRWETKRASSGKTIGYGTLRLTPATYNSISGVKTSYFNIVQINDKRKGQEVKGNIYSTESTLELKLITGKEKWYGYCYNGRVEGLISVEGKSVLYNWTMY